MKVNQLLEVNTKCQRPRGISHTLRDQDKDSVKVYGRCKLCVQGMETISRNNGQEWMETIQPDAEKQKEQVKKKRITASPVSKYLAPEC